MDCRNLQESLRETMRSGEICKFLGKMMQEGEAIVLGGRMCYACVIDIKGGRAMGEKRRQGPFDFNSDGQRDFWERLVERKWYEVFQENFWSKPSKPATPICPGYEEEEETAPNEISPEDMAFIIELQRKSREEQERRDRMYKQSPDLPFAYYTFCQVRFPPSPKIRYYRTSDLKIEVGDRVLVPKGTDDVPTVGEVIAVQQCNTYSAPAPVEQTKEIIKKVVRRPWE